MTVQPLHEYQPVYQERDAWIPVMDKVAELSKMLAQTPFVGAFRGKPGDVFGAILYGHHLHLAPLQALQAFDLIEGKPTLKSEARRALFLREGHRLDILQWDAKKCTVRAERSDGLASVEVTYSIDDAQLAGLMGKKNWRTSPKQMLLARASSMAISAIAPDVALGIDVAMDTETQERPPQPTATQVVRIGEPAPDPVVEAPMGVVDMSTGEITSEPVEPVADLITAAQMRKIGAQIGEYERATSTRLDKEARRNYIATLAGIDGLASAKNLTRDQASTVIEALTHALTAIPPVTDSDETEVNP